MNFKFEPVSIEQIVFIVMAGIVMYGCVTTPACANEGAATLPIKAGIVQCGNMKDMERMCADEPRCCVFIEPAAGEYSNPPEERDHAITTTCELWWRDDGTAATPVCVRNRE